MSNRAPLSTGWLVIRSLVYHARSHLAVVLGVAAGTAVLTGALLVGDSVRGSLRDLALDRLGKIDHILVSDRFFRAALADEFLSDANVKSRVEAAVPAILLPGCTAETSTGETSRRATNITLVAADAAFWSLHAGGPRPERELQDGEIVLNEPLAADLGVKQGDEVVVRLPTGNQVPADSPLGRRTDRVQNLAQLRVVDILPAKGLGRFGMRSTQNLPRNAYLPLRVVQSELKQPDKINALLVSGAAQSDRDPKIATLLSQSLRPSLADYGLKLSRIRQEYQSGADQPSETVFDYIQLSTDRLLLSDATVGVVREAWKPYAPQEVLTYLAMTITRAADPSISIPVSTITGIDSTASLGPLLQADKTPMQWTADDELVLNSWAAEDLRASPGDRLIVRYFEPETTHGEPVLTTREFTLTKIIPITEPAIGFRRNAPPKYESRPTLANDSNLTPVVEGFTDQATINDWDPPFPYDKKSIRPQDDDYWSNHRTTPKAFVSLREARRLWGSRFGATTSIRVETTPDVDAERLETVLLDALHADRSAAAFTFLPIKAQAIAASSGTTPFDMLFLGLSSFIIAAALMLVALLFRLNIERRARELGVLMAVGLPKAQLRRIWIQETCGLAVAGGLLGVAAGVGYGWLMLAGLRTWWLGAISTPFLQLHVTERSLIVGLVSGVGLSAAVILWSLRQLRRVHVRQLLAGNAAESSLMQTKQVYGPKLSLMLIASAIGLGLMAVGLTGESQAGAFMTSGMLVLVAILFLIRWRLRTKAATATLATATGAIQLRTLAASNAARAPNRTLLTVGLLASACFLIIAMSAFRLDATRAGAGGFDLMGISSQPVFEDLNRDDARRDRFGDQADQLAGTTIFGLRYKPGDDASCNNLYQSTQPQVIGITPSFRDYYDRTDVVAFSWAASQTPSTGSGNPSKNPWHTLFTPVSNGPIPVVIDKNTAMYSLHLMGGVGQVFRLQYEGNREVEFQVAGLLAGSVLQGSLMISEDHFRAAFPDIAGYRYFFVQAPLERHDAIAAVLENGIGDQGLDVRATTDVLTDLLAVQNTYLSTFQSLGALGLLLGTFGLATVQLRNVWERTAELAVLRAAGFSQSRISLLIGLEHSLLLLGGVSTGVFAAVIAVFPHALAGGASPPWRDLCLMIGTIILVGLITGRIAVRSAFRLPLVAALRAE